MSKVKLFTEKANARSPAMKFSGEVLQIETTLLDTKVCKEEKFRNDTILDVRRYFKLLKPFIALNSSKAVTQQALKKV